MRTCCQEKMCTFAVFAIQMSEKNCNIGIRVTAERREELKIAAAKRRTSVQKLVEQALELIVCDATTNQKGRKRDQKKSVGWHVIDREGTRHRLVGITETAIGVASLFF